MEITKAINDTKVLRFIITAFIGTIFLTISAKIKIPFYPVPMTMQTFGGSYLWESLLDGKLG